MVFLSLRVILTFFDNLERDTDTIDSLENINSEIIV